MTAEQAKTLDEIIAHTGRRIAVFQANPDPRGPRNTIDPMTGKEAWLTRPLWAMGQHLAKLAEVAEALGCYEQAATARRMVSDLHGSARSPEELVACIQATRPGSGRG